MTYCQCVVIPNVWRLAHSHEPGAGSTGAAGAAGRARSPGGRAWLVRSATRRRAGPEDDGRSRALRRRVTLISRADSRRRPHARSTASTADSPPTVDARVSSCDRCHAGRDGAATCPGDGERAASLRGRHRVLDTDRGPLSLPALAAALPSATRRAAVPPTCAHHADWS